jgi:hypothetical protein
MSSKKTTLLVSAAVMAVASQTEAFVPASAFVAKTQTTNVQFTSLYAEETKETETDAVFMPPEELSGDNEIGLDKVEQLGRGAAKVRLDCIFLLRPAPLVTRKILDRSCAVILFSKPKESHHRFIL